MLGLICVQPVCKGYQQTAKVAPSGQKDTYKKQLVDTTFCLKSWLKLISFGSNFFHLARVLDTTKSEPGPYRNENVAALELQYCGSRAAIKF